MPAYLEVLGAFLKLGVSSFGGPAAHLGYFHSELVERRRWVGEAEFADLVALCQFLPGPGSSQLAFALGYRRAGVGGAVLAALAFTLPSAVLMLAFAYGVSRLSPLGQPGWLQGLKVAAVAVVAQAVILMARRLCPDVPRAVLALAGAAIVLLLNSAYGQIAALVVGAAVGVGLGGGAHGPHLSRAQSRDALSGPSADGVAQRMGAMRSTSALRGGAIILGLWAALLVALPWWSRQHPGSAADVFTRFYRAGALVFGGGHVVLPLLREQVVPPGWTTDNLFLAGYGAAQAVPGPLFTFSAYLGSVIHAGFGGWRGGLWTLLAIFLPGWLLISGTLPFWFRARAYEPLRAAMRGTNASVVGILAAALYRPIWVSAIHGPRYALLAAAAFAALTFARLPAWAAVVCCAGVGALVL